MMLQKYTSAASHTRCRSTGALILSKQAKITTKSFLSTALNQCMGVLNYGLSITDQSDFGSHCRPFTRGQMIAEHSRGLYNVEQYFVCN